MSDQGDWVSAGSVGAAGLLLIVAAGWYIVDLYTGHIANTFAAGCACPLAV